MRTSQSSDTIAAISSPPGEGAIALIRITGPDTLKVLERIFSAKTAVFQMQPRRAYHGNVLSGGKIIDNGLAILFSSPASYTGEDLAEVTCHGGILLAAQVLEAALTAGARAAEPGEFTQRAFLNGKMDLTQAEAVMDVIRARTPIALRAAAEQLQGRIGNAVESIRAALLQIVAHVEAWIDFPEEGIDPDTGAKFLQRIREAKSEITSLLATAEEGRILREGVRLVIVGKPNAGKSSLLNRLLGFERAIVSATPGTTRDTIEELANLHGIPFRITDTAGLRETKDTVEREGVERARRMMEDADIVLHVVDSTEGVASHALSTRELLVFNKYDLTKESPEGAIRVSCLTGEGLEELVTAIVAKVGLHHLGTSSLAAVNVRHKALLQTALDALERAEVLCQENQPPEFIALELRTALETIGAIIGAVDTEEILGAIFGSFCIGK